VLMNMVMQGIAMMTARRSPSLMRETLKSFAAHYEDEIFDGSQAAAKSKSWWGRSAPRPNKPATRTGDPP